MDPTKREERTPGCPHGEQAGPSLVWSLETTTVDEMKLSGHCVYRNSRNQNGIYSMSAMLKKKVYVPTRIGEVYWEKQANSRFDWETSVLSNFC